MATATQSRRVKFPWKRKWCERQIRQRCRKERKIQRCWSTCVESTTESACELSGIVYTTDGNKHNGWHGWRDWVHSVGSVRDCIETAGDWESSLDSLQCRYWSRRTCVANERGLRIWENFRSCRSQWQNCNRWNGRRTGTVSSSLSKCLGTSIAHDWRKDVSSQTTVECCRRYRQKTRALVGRKRWLHHPKGLTNSDSNAHVFSKSLRATFVEWSHWSDERTWSVQSLRPGGWRRWQHWASSWCQSQWNGGRWVRPSCIGVPSAGEPVRPREMGVPSDGGEEAVAPRVPPVPAKPTQAEQDEHYATGHAAYCSWCEHCVKGWGRASPHAVVPEGVLPEVGVDYAYLGLEGSQVTILVCKCKRIGCLAATQVPEKGMNVYALAFFTGWLRGLGWKRLLLRSDIERAF